jgi:UDP-glucose 4-epimerase
MKKILITGANSYIGTSFEEYAKNNYSNEFQITTLDMVDSGWRDQSFSEYDIVFHVAGLAHADIGNVDEATKAKYYAINTDLAIETARKAKEEGIKQFVFMSSSIVYGDSAPYGVNRRITRDTKPCPSNFYGDSKWKADEAVRLMASDSFTVTVLRPPMIYGKGSKGNYPTLAKLIKLSPIFPKVKNERSMLYIENLCEFLCQVMIRNSGGIFWPQNKEYSVTSDLAELISKVSGHKIIISKAFNFIVEAGKRMPGKIRNLTNKAFGNLSYEQSMSTYDFQYQIVSLEESIRRTEGQ